MNFYKRHLGDIAKACGHLSQGQMGAYDLLLDWLYSNEKPLPLSPDSVHRIGRAVTKAEKANVDAVLGEFFLRTAEGYTQKRAIEEIAKADAQADTNRRIAEAREAAKRARKEHEACNEPSDASCTNRQPSQTPDTRQEQKPKQERSPTGSRLPPDWTPSDADASFAATERPDVDWRTEADKFRDYWHGVAGAKGRKADWPSTWRNWIRRADGKPRAGPSAAPSKHLTGLANILGVSPHDLTDHQHPRTVVRHADRELLGDDLRSEPRRLSGR